MFHERSMGWRGRSGGVAWTVAVGLTLFAAGGVSVRADTIHVPEDYKTIQEGIDAAEDGDEVVVAPGTYFERITMPNRTITIRSSDGPEVTFIDGQQQGSVVTCTSGAGPDTMRWCRGHHRRRISGGFRPPK